MNYYSDSIITEFKRKQENRAVVTALRLDDRDQKHDFQCVALHYTHFGITSLEIPIRVNCGNTNHQYRAEKSKSGTQYLHVKTALASK